MEGLTSIAKTELQLAYADFVFGTSKRWRYIMRTTPNISGTLTVLEEKVHNTLIPTLTGHNCSDTEREIFALAARYGGLDLITPTENIQTQ